MIKIALIGLGYWGKILYRVISEHPDFKLVATCDTLTDNLRDITQKDPAVFLCTDYKKLAAVEFDAVVVATNIKSHFEICEFFIRRKKHVFCEKTLTDDSNRSKLLGSLLSKNQVLFVGFVFLFNQGIEYLKNMIESKSIGKIHYLNLQRTGLGPVRKDIDVIFDLGSHDISILNYLLNKTPSYVSAQGISLKKKNIYDAAFIQLHYAETIANIHVSWAHPIKERKITLTGKNKMVVFDDVTNIDKIKIYDSGVSYQVNNKDFGQFQLSLRDGDIHIPKLSHEEPLKLELDAFYAAITKRKKFIPDYRFSINVEKVIEAAYTSIKQNSKKIKIS